MAFTSIERDAKRLRIYIGESDRWRGMPLYTALLEKLKQEGLAGATVIRGIAGFGAHSRIHTAAILDLSVDLPLIIEVVDTSDRIQHAVEMISPMVREGLVTVENVEVITYTHRLLRPLPADRPVREIMTSAPVTAGEDEPVQGVWNKMLASNVKALPVINKEQQVVGLLTQDDFLDRVGINARLAVARQLDEDSLNAEVEILRNSQLTAREVMSQPPITIRPDESIGLAAERMVRHSITRLPVVEEDSRLVGIVSRLDLLRQVIDVQGKAKKKTPQASGRLAREVMTPDVPLIGEEMDLSGIIASFVASGEHRVIVVDENKRPVGLISDSDVIGRIRPQHRRGILDALRGKKSLPDVSISARELMSPGAETISLDTGMVEAIQKMVQSYRKWLVVVDQDGLPVGLVDREIALQALIR